MDKFFKKILSTSSLLSKSFVVGLLSMFLLSKYLYTDVITLEYEAYNFFKHSPSFDAHTKIKIIYY